MMQRKYISFLLLTFLLFAALPAHGSFASCGYENNAIGNRVSTSRSGSVFAASDTISYSYNGRGELTGAVSDAAGTDYSYAFSFDPIGNRLNASLVGQSVSYTANLLNQYTAVNADAPTYDLDGNMLTNGDWSYTWNGENRLVRAENAVTGTALEFDYDYMGRRIFKKVYHGTVLEKHLLFVYDGYKLIEERDALDGGSLVRQYAWQPEALGRDVPLTVHDAASNATYYYHTDANKNVTELTDESGAVVAHYEYSPFGTVTRATGPFAADNPFRFSSEYHDDETGLIYYNYRYYSPELGRWLSRDPIEELGGFNLYGMLGNNPMLGWDDRGYVVETIWDICSFCLGVDSMIENIREGNYWAATIDAGGVALDAAAIFAPFVPGGVSAGIKATRAADKAGDALRAADKTRDAIRTTDKVQDAVRASDKVNDVSKSRNAAFRDAKRANDIPVSQQPTKVGPSRNRHGKEQPGKLYEFGEKKIRDDAKGHTYRDDPSQNRGPHFNDDKGRHYDYHK